MKFKVIDAADVDIIREARKVLKRLQKRINRLDKKRETAFVYAFEKHDMIAKEEYRLLDELDALHVRAEANCDMSLEV